MTCPACNGTHVVQFQGEEAPCPLCDDKLTTLKVTTDSPLPPATPKLDRFVLQESRTFTLPALASGAVADLVDRAITTERARCARVARWFARYSTGAFHPYYAAACDAIARQIESGEEPSDPAIPDNPNPMSFR